MLEHPLSVRSRIGRGSMFSIRVPRAARARGAVAGAAPVGLPDSLAGCACSASTTTPTSSTACAALLGRWGVIEVLRAATVDEALACMDDAPDVLLVDYHLHDRLDGLDMLDALRRGRSRDLPARCSPPTAANR